jgi:hypothetical protein
LAILQDAHQDILKTLPCSEGLLEVAEVRQGEGASTVCSICGAKVCGVENLLGHRAGRRCSRKKGGADSKIEECRAVEQFVKEHACPLRSPFRVRCPCSEAGL